jgi:hypothetical protein
MPNKKYVITVLDGTWNGYKFTRWTQHDADGLVDALGRVGMQCKVEIIALH